MRCDVTEWADNENIAAAAIDAFGGFDAVFANAGFGAKRGFLEESPEFWREMVLTNVVGVGYTIRATLPHLLERDAGHYVITSSVAGRRALPGSCTRRASGRHRHGRVAAGGAAPDARQQLDPGHADRARHRRHAVLRQPAEGALEDADIARAVLYALGQPERVDVNEVLIRPTTQSG